MSLTKKQKNFIRKHIQNEPPDRMAKQLGIDVQTVKGYIAQAGLLHKAHRETHLEKPQTASLWQHPLFYPFMLIVFGLAAGLYCFDVNMYISGDNVEFLDLGRSIRRGDGLMERTKYPFLFPLYLAFFQLISNDSLLWQKVAVFLLYLGSIPVLFAIFRYYLQPVWAAALIIITMSNSYILEFSHYTMSEVPYLFISLVGLLCIERSIRQPESWRIWGFSLLGVMAAYYTRTAGLALIAGWVAYYLWHRQWKWAGITGAGIVLAMLPWTIRNAMLPAGNSYMRQIIMVNPYRPDMGTLTASSLWDRIFTNIKVYFLAEIPQTLFPWNFMTTMFHQPTPPQWFGAVLSLLFVVGLFYLLIQKRNILALYCGAYLGVILLWPQVWSGSRFLIPATPVIIFITFYGIYSLLRHRRWNIPTYLQTGIPVTIIVIWCMLSFRNIYEYGSFKHYPIQWANYFKAAEWVRENTPEDIVFSDRKPSLFREVSLREGVGFRTGPAVTADTIFAHFDEKNVSVMILPLIGYSDVLQYLAPLVNNNPHRFRLLHIEGVQQSQTETYVFQYLPEAKSEVVQ